MFRNSTWGHLRIKRMWIYMSALFLFPWSQATPEVMFSWSAVLIYTATLLFLFPASTGYNGYYDKDEKSISGYENPEPVTDELLYVSIAFEGIALFLAYFVNVWFFGYVLVFAIASKAYSHPSLRFKEGPLLGWFMNIFFYGYLTGMAVLLGLTGGSALFLAKYHFVAIIMSSPIMGLASINQVFQHEEDAKKGFRTGSHMMGVKGTLDFAIVSLLLTGLALMTYFYRYYPPGEFYTIAFVHTLCAIPSAYYFREWYLRVCKDEREANLKSVMKLCNIILPLGILFYTWLGVYSYMNHVK